VVVVLRGKLVMIVEITYVIIKSLLVKGILTSELLLIII
jgi:hypothetical protein